MQLLVVEDEIDSQQVIAQLMEIVHVGVDLANDAEEALQFLNHNRYDAVLIDLALPGMDGFELIQQIRQNYPTLIKCVAITAYHSADVKKGAHEAGFDGYFPKPLNIRGFSHELMKIINS